MTADAGIQVLVLNSGSSSLKFGVFETGPGCIDALVTGEATAIGTDGGFNAKDAAGREISEHTRFEDHRHVISRLLRLLGDWNLPPPAAVGHRIVHGGPKLGQHCVIDRRVLEILKSAIAFAPLHIPEALSLIRAATDLFPDLPQVACFDTSFHRSMPDIARTLPIPRALEADGIHRYGFHGLSCESIVAQLGAALPERLVIAHLGNGASITAVKGGRSMDTSMGLTPTGGVMMGTRSGDLDPGVVLYLLREKKMDVAALEGLLDLQSGLLGVSGVGSDMRALQAVALVDPDARLAIDMFGYQVRKAIAGMTAVMGGVDGLVFTGGIGQNDSSLRAAICQGLDWMGVALDPAYNRSGSGSIQSLASRCTVAVLPSQEDEQIAWHTHALVRSHKSADSATRDG